MLTVRQILNQKGGSFVYTIGANDFVFRAVRMMADYNVGALIVMERDEVVGIISERDYARRLILEGRSSRSTTVSEVMTQQVLYAVLDQSADECMALMTEKRVRHLPVLDNGKLIGVISTGDVIKAIVSKQEFIIDQLSRYITNSHSGEEQPSQLFVLNSIAEAA